MLYKMKNKIRNKYKKPFTEFDKEKALYSLKKLKEHLFKNLQILKTHNIYTFDLQKKQREYIKEWERIISEPIEIKSIQKRNLKSLLAYINRKIKR